MTHHVRLPRRRITAGEVLDVIELLAEAAGHPRILAVDVLDRTAEAMVLRLDRSERRRLRYALAERMRIDREWVWCWAYLGGRPDPERRLPAAPIDDDGWKPVSA